MVVAVTVAAPGSSQPQVRSGVYTVQPDPRLCPSPLCGGYWAALANEARTTCEGGTRRPRCYVANAVDGYRHPLELSIPAGALVRADLEPWDFEGLGQLGVLVVAAVFAPAGTAAVSGGYYRVIDTGIRCIRAPCFSYRATQVNGSTRTAMSGVDLEASGATPAEVARGQTALHTKKGLLARGRFSRAANGGIVFRASRLFLTAPRPRA